MTAHAHILPLSRPTVTVFERGALIDGKWLQSESGEAIERLSPAHDVLVSCVPRCGRPETETAIAAARRAFDNGPWPGMSGAERAGVLNRAADLMEARAEEITLLDTLEAGKPISQTRGEIVGAIDIWRYAAALARNLHGESYSSLGEAALGFVLREPIGVVSIITPWNFPFLIVSQKVPFALAAGCTVVAKPSEMTSASTLLLGEILLEAGLPAGVCNIVTGFGPEVGTTMTAHPAVDMVSFTGSTRVGKLSMKAAAETLKKVSFELGGKNPQIIFADADLDAARDAVVFGAFFNAGECCNAGSRLLVQREIADNFAAEITALSGKVPVGDPLNPETKVGAIISHAHLETIESRVSDAQQDGADVLVGGERLDLGTGGFMAPTILTGVRPEMDAAREEIFGPVLSVIPFDDVDDAIRIANSTVYGLSVGVWSRDFDTCLNIGRKVRAGTVWMNTFMDGFAELPFGGYGQSGIGRELGRHAVEDYTETKTLHMHTGQRTAWWIPRH